VFIRGSNLSSILGVMKPESRKPEAFCRSPLVNAVVSCNHEALNMSESRPNSSEFIYEPSPERGGEDVYELAETKLVGPPLPGEVVTAETADELIDKLAADLVVHAENCVRQFGDFHLALSGGSTPQPLYERLMYDPNYRRLPWRRTHLWIVDERCVPFDDARSNFKMIRETIVDHADIPNEQVHPIFAMSETADADYESQLRETLAWREKGQDRLDYVLLGMGADGHTASLFPHTSPLHESKRLVRLNTYREVSPAQRVTMTYPLINSARFIAILITGRSKATVLHRIATGRESLDELPIKGVSPLNGELKWYLDAAACGVEAG
jgi:6-phosphogluconolactonase